MTAGKRADTCSSKWSRLKAIFWSWVILNTQLIWKVSHYYDSLPHTPLTLYCISSLPAPHKCPTIFFAAKVDLTPATSTCTQTINAGIWEQTNWTPDPNILGETDFGTSQYETLSTPPRQMCTVSAFMTTSVSPFRACIPQSALTVPTQTQAYCLWVVTILQI